MILECCATITCRYGDRCNICNRVGDTTKIVLEAAHGKFLEMFICERCQEEGCAVKFQLDVVDTDRGREAKKRIKQSRELEEELAKDMGGKAQPGSGNSLLPGYKGDVRQMGGWRLEHKFTDSLKQYTLKLIDLARITKIAMRVNELPALIINFRAAGESFAVIPYSLFLEMAHATKKHQGPAKRRRR